MTSNELGNMLSEEFETSGAGGAVVVVGGCCECIALPMSDQSYPCVFFSSTTFSL